MTHTACSIKLEGKKHVVTYHGFDKEKDHVAAFLTAWEDS